MRDAIRRCASALGAKLDDAAVERLATWLALLADRNRSIDLTAARTEDDLVELMVADAVVAARHVPPGARVVDVGSGAGGPGLGLALIRRDLAVTLVEPLQKRVAFLRAAAGAALGAAAERMPEVVRGRGEDLVGRRAFDLALSRATLAPADWLALGARLAPAGAVVTLLARDAPPLLEGWSVVATDTYTTPFGGAPRTLVVHRRGGGVV